MHFCIINSTKEYILEQMARPYDGSEDSFMKDRAILWIECFEETVSCECFEGKLSKQEKTVDL